MIPNDHIWPFDDGTTLSPTDEVLAFAKVNAHRIDSHDQQGQSVLTPECKALGKIVSDMRKEKGWTRRMLSEMTGLSFVWLSLLEEGSALVSEVTPEVISTLTQAFEIADLASELSYEGHQPQDPPIAVQTQASVHVEHENTLDNRSTSEKLSGRIQDLLDVLPEWVRKGHLLFSTEESVGPFEDVLSKLQPIGARANQDSMLVPINVTLKDGCLANYGYEDEYRVAIKLDPQGSSAAIRLELELPYEDEDVATIPLHISAIDVRTGTVLGQCQIDETFGSGDMSIEDFDGEVWRHLAFIANQIS